MPTVEWGIQMSEPATSTLTVAKLKALCIINDLPTSGKKAVLVDRLLDAGIDATTLGVEISSPQEDEAPPSNRVDDATTEEEFEGEVLLSLEDEDTLTPKHSSSKPPETTQEDPVLEAEILDATLIDDPEEPSSASEERLLSLEEPSTIPDIETDPPKVQRQSPATLMDLLRRPQAVAILLTALVLGAGGWYYINNQLEPFTADSLRYGDEMRYVVTEGSFMASDEYVTLIADQLNGIEEYCKIRILFEGVGELSITDGTALDLTPQANDDRLGAVSAKGGQGMDWLAVESVNAQSFSKFDVFGHRTTTGVTGGEICRVTGEGREGTADIVLTRWTELREKASLATQVDLTLQNAGGTYDGTGMVYGVGGLAGGLERLSPGLGTILQPVELAEFFGNDLITEGATGLNSNWEWRVVGTEKFGSTNMWKIAASHRDVRDLCLGSANMNLWLDGVSPWAVRQTVDVSISSDETSQDTCSNGQRFAGGLILPNGELELHHIFERTMLERGVKAIELGKSYDNRPQANELNPDDDELSSWGVDDEHLPDNSSQRSHPLDAAMSCLPTFGSSASGATSALEDRDGYIWRALNEPNGSSTNWNISWVANDNTAGWLKFSVSGTVEALECEYLAKGTYDDSITHNRNAIPEVLSLDALESRYQDNNRFPALRGENSLFSSTGALHPETQIGYLVVVPGTGFGLDFSELFDSVTGATTVDMQREWTQDNWDHSFSLAGDASDGRIVGWAHVRSMT